MKTINHFISAFNDETYQLALQRIYSDKAGQDSEEWANELYLLFRDHPLDPRASSLNRDRKACLLLLYELVDTWEASADPDVFEQDIRAEFGVERIQRILQVCLIMDRAQCLYKLQIPNLSTYGMHWYSKPHLQQNNPYAKAYPEEQAALVKALEGYQGSATMNKRLFQLLYTPSFGLLQDTHLARWARPKLATFVERPPVVQEQPGLNTAAELAADQVPTPARPVKRLKPVLQQNLPLQDTILEFVQAYDEPEYQNRLERLHHDKGSQDPETWAQNFYVNFRDHPKDPRLVALHQDCQECLELVYALLDVWQQHQGLGSEFEEAVKEYFKVRRMARILSVCLVMKRAQALYGDHATMDSRLYQVLHSQVLGLQLDPYFAKWSLDVPAPQGLGHQGTKY